MAMVPLLCSCAACSSNTPAEADPEPTAVVQIGDASASQSPLSFGGFGNMLRHLPRLIEGTDQALRWGSDWHAVMALSACGIFPCNSGCPPYPPRPAAGNLTGMELSQVPG